MTLRTLAALFALSLLTVTGSGCASSSEEATEGEDVGDEDDPNAAVDADAAEASGCPILPGKSAYIVRDGVRAGAYNSSSTSSGRVWTFNPTDQLYLVSRRSSRGYVKVELPLAASNSSKQGWVSLKKVYCAYNYHMTQ